jgi:hypothetical protein
MQTYSGEKYFRMYGKFSVERLIWFINFNLLPLGSDNPIKYVGDYIAYWWGSVGKSNKKRIRKPPPLFGRKHSFAKAYLEELKVNVCKSNKLCKLFEEVEHEEVPVQIEKISQLVYYKSPPMRYGEVEPALVAVLILRIGVKEFCSRSSFLSNKF